MPTEQSQMTDSFQYRHFTWEHNVNFIHYAGTFAAVVKFDMNDRELYALLDQLNGVYLTGGPLNLIDTHTLKQHTYYKTAKKIIKYAKDEYEKGRYFPIFAICQGFELIHMVENDDDPNETLSEVRIYAESRRVNWAV